MTDQERLRGLRSRRSKPPVIVAAFEGWNDAADAASNTVAHLAQSWETTEVSRLDPEEYYDFQVNRPLLSFGADGARELTWPTTRVLLASPPASDRDVLLIRGIEPNLRWRAFCAELLELVVQAGAESVVTVAALLADTPHTRPVPVTTSSNEPGLADRLGLEPSRYEGPTGIVGVFEDACNRAGISAASLWAAVPHYVAQPPCPKATLSLLGQLEELLGVSVPVGDLPEESRAWQRGVEELTESDEDIAQYVRALEENRDTAELPEASGDAIAKEFERYLKRRASGD